MARRPTLINKKPKKIRVNRSESYLINRKYMGDEPEFLGAMTEGEMAIAYNWYNAMLDKSEIKEYTETWLRNQNRLAEIKRFKSVPDEWVNHTCAAIARMITRGYDVPAHSRKFLEETFAYTLTKAKIQPESDIPRASIQDRMREKQSDIIGDIEELIDKGETFSLYDWLKAKQVPASYCPAIAVYYSPQLGELIETMEGNDPQLKEAYSYLTKKQLRDRIDFYNKLIGDAERYGNVTKKTRTPRKPRAVSVEKKLKNFKYQKEDNTFKIASVNPEKLIGCQELWTFNTKYKIVTVLRALDITGLQVKGTSVIGYDEANSLSKGIGRGPMSTVILDKIPKTGKLALKKMIEELKYEKPLQHRINENTILLKIT
jgi:hypothetical protein